MISRLIEFLDVFLRHGGVLAKLWALIPDRILGCFPQTWRCFLPGSRDLLGWASLQTSSYSFLPSWNGDPSCDSLSLKQWNIKRQRQLQRQRQSFPFLPSWNSDPSCDSLSLKWWQIQCQIQRKWQSQRHQNNWDTKDWKTRSLNIIDIIPSSHLPGPKMSLWLNSQLWLSGHYLQLLLLLAAVNNLD